MKDIVKKSGGRLSMPSKSRRGSEDSADADAKAKPQKVDYISLVIQLLGEKYQNDYKAVAQYLQTEVDAKSQKGFGSKKEKN